MSRYIKRKPIPLFHQLNGLKLMFPDGTGGVYKNKITWICNINPTSLSRLYTVRIEYQLEKSPSVFVVRPELKALANGKEIPHLYSQEKENLCLFYPKYKEWNPTMHISETIVPWVYEWFFYFEEWLISNEWKGGGFHPGKQN